MNVKVWARFLRQAEWLGITAVIVGFLGVTFFFDPSQASVFPPCSFYGLTGFYCPACGSTRGIHQLLHGHVWEALDYNLFFIPLLPVLFVCYLYYVRFRIKGGKLFPELRSVRPLWVWMFVLSLFGFWVLRNVPVYPFTFLAP